MKEWRPLQRYSGQAALFFYSIRAFFYAKHPFRILFNILAQVFSFIFPTVDHYANITLQLCRMHLINLLNLYAQYYLLILTIPFLIWAAYLSFTRASGSVAVDYV